MRVGPDCRQFGKHNGEEGKCLNCIAKGWGLSEAWALDYCKGFSLYPMGFDGHLVGKKRVAGMIGTYWENYQ